jgi:predicted NBD/HSP70 family sugar kinase
MKDEIIPLLRLACPHIERCMAKPPRSTGQTAARVTSLSCREPLAPSRVVWPGLRSRSEMSERKKARRTAKKDKQPQQTMGLGAHGAEDLPDVILKSYNLEIRNEEGFIGDRASGGAFRALLDEVRAQVSEVSKDPLGKKSSKQLSKKQLDRILANGDSVAAGIIHGAIEEFAKQLAGVVRRYLRLKAWRETERIVVGGGIRQSRVGELVIGRAAVILKSERVDVDLLPIRVHPDEAGLLGCAHLAPAWLYRGFGGLVAVDIGGSNIRTGIVKLNAKRASNLSRAAVAEFEIWRHSEEKPNREKAVDRLIEMLERSIAKARRARIKLAPLIAIGCPGEIAPDGSINAGAQNLPGNWESTRFNLPALIRERIPAIGKHETAAILHNDAVVQGLSEVPFMQDVEHWAVLTIGTGLGNASFENKKP